jgi:hypothetical protein
MVSSLIIVSQFVGAPGVPAELPRISASCGKDSTLPSWVAARQRVDKRAALTRRWLDFNEQHSKTVVGAQSEDVLGFPHAPNIGWQQVIGAKCERRALPVPRLA